MPWPPSPAASSSASRSAKRQRTGAIKLEDDEAQFQVHAPPTAAMTEQPIVVANSRISEEELVSEQKLAIEIIARGHNLYLAGGAGSGKTAVLEHAVARLRNIGKRVRVCAPTGIAAHGAGGITIHSLFGLDPNKAKDQLQRLEARAQYGTVQTRLAQTDVLIIDEISMVEKIFFERLNRMIQAARDDDHPFGSTQVVVCGDFRQLPPVKPFENCFSCGGTTIRRIKNRIAVKVCKICLGEEDETRYWAFLSTVWKDLNFVNIKLEDNHRQGEHDFITVLNKLGDGIPLRHPERSMLMRNDGDAEGGLVVMALRDDVEAVNDREFAGLRTEQVDYNCLDFFDMRPRHCREYGDLKELSWDRKTLKALSGHPYPPLLNLKVDEEVLLTVNINVENGLVNGSRGRIVRFESFDATNTPRAGSGIDQPQPASSEEGQEISEASMDVRSGENRTLRQEQAKAFLMKTNLGAKLPVVRFKNGMEKTIWPECSMTQIGDDEPYSYLCRTQLPLVAGYAVTIHKAQGMTVDRLIVDISGIFATGMAYVALSRVKTLRGLKVIGPESALDKYGANPEAMKFLRETKWYKGLVNLALERAK